MHRRLRGGVRLSLRRGDSDVGVGVAALSAFLQRVASEGVPVTLSDACKSSGTLGLPGVPPPVVGPDPLSVATLDLNGDRRLDLAVANPSSDSVTRSRITSPG